MKKQLEHFEAEAERTVPHLSADERKAWAKHAHENHPGHDNRIPQTVAPGDQQTAPAVFIGPQTITIIPDSQESPMPLAMPVPVVSAPAKPEANASDIFAPGDVADWLWRIAVLALLLFIAAHAARAQTLMDRSPVAEAPPRVITQEDRASFEHLRLQAAHTANELLQAVINKLNGELAEAKANLAQLQAQQTLDDQNEKIAVFYKKMRESAGASDQWCLDQNFNWNRREGEKPCPPLQK
jgi:hypothetical protein